MKDPVNCPYCEAEEKGYSEGWGFSPEGWDMMWEKHINEHCDTITLSCDTDNSPEASSDITYCDPAIPYTLTGG